MAIFKVEMPWFLFFFHHSELELEGQTPILGGEFMGISKVFLRSCGMPPVLIANGLGFATGTKKLVMIDHDISWYSWCQYLKLKLRKWALKASTVAGSRSGVVRSVGVMELLSTQSSLEWSSLRLGHYMRFYNFWPFQAISLYYQIIISPLKEIDSDDGLIFQKNRTTSHFYHILTGKSGKSSEFRSVLGALPFPPPSRCRHRSGHFLRWRWAGLVRGHRSTREAQLPWGRLGTGLEMVGLPWGWFDL